MTEKAEDYLWSSTAAHCGLCEDDWLDTRHEAEASKMFRDSSEWSAWLQESDNPAHVEMFRCHINKNLPCGSDSFVQKLETLTGQVLSYRPIGRPKKG